MKKVLLVLSAIALMSFGLLSFSSTEFEQQNEFDSSDCPSYSTQVNWNCGSTCLTYKRELSGFLEIDATIGFENPYRKPTIAELVAFINAQNAQCD